ncbi:MAG: UDP-2,3-diacylglucosamine hydrolase [Candidatus Pelagibacter sp.]|nr:UDP-2,3-diacylglucosamine hydrolase [Candidatus Pelagibacter sp.]|tara:strand:- start:3157 stop:4011 length:855 start_codon:yes stop_codon:yes gene_type:complete
MLEKKPFLKTVDGKILQYKSIWISDIHLGTKGCQADMVLEFIKYTRSENLYLVGDIVDGWALKKNWYWPQQHNDVIQKILRKARHGTRVFYLAGNHDEILRKFIPINLGNVEILNQLIHEGINGKKYWVVHGDQFDGIIRYAKWLSVLGSFAYETLISFNRYLNYFRRRLGKEYWSLSKYLKHKVKNAVQFISEFETMVVETAKKQKADGVICGHIHNPTIEEIKNIEYKNCGDWVESCTALVEHFDGKFELVNWLNKRKEILNSVYVEEQFDENKKEKIRIVS